MKRIVASILAILYLGVSIGATISKHYCMGEFVSISLFGEEQKSCSRCGMEKHSDSDCCKDIKITIKSDKKHLPSQLALGLNNKFTAVSLDYMLQSEVFLNENNLFHPMVRHKPPLSSCPIYIHVQDFRI